MRKKKEIAQHSEIISKNVVEKKQPLLSLSCAHRKLATNVGYPLLSYLKIFVKRKGMNSLSDKTNTPKKTGDQKIIGAYRNNHK